MNNAAIAAETSSPAAGINAVAWLTAAAFAALIAEAKRDKSEAAADTNCGADITNDICHLRQRMEYLLRLPLAALHATWIGSNTLP